MKKIMFALIVALSPIGAVAQVTPPVCTTNCPAVTLPAQNVFDTPARYENTTGNNESLRQALDRLMAAYRFNYDFVDGTDTSILDRFAYSGRFPASGTAPLREVLRVLLERAQARPANFEGNLVVINGPRREVRPATVPVDTLYVDNRSVGTVPARVNYDDDRVGIRPRESYVGGSLGQRNAAVTYAAIGTHGGGYYDNYGVYRTPVEFARDVRRFDIEGVKASVRINGGVSERSLQDIEIWVDCSYVAVASLVNNMWNDRIPVQAGVPHVIEFKNMKTGRAFSRPISPESMAVIQTASGDERSMAIRIDEHLFTAQGSYDLGDTNRPSCRP